MDEPVLARRTYGRLAKEQALVAPFLGSTRDLDIVMDEERIREGRLQRLAEEAEERMAAKARFDRKAQSQHRIASQAKARREEAALKAAMAEEERDKQRRFAAAEHEAARAAFAEAKRLEAERTRSSRDSQMIEVRLLPLHGNY